MDQFTPIKETIIKIKQDDPKVSIPQKKTSNNQILLTASGKKINDDNELPICDKVGIEIGKQIMQARLAKKLKQTDLAKQLNMTPDIIRDYENGSAIRNNSVLSKIKKALNIK